MALGMYLATGAYTPKGAAGLLETGAVRRADQLGQIAGSLGGRLVDLYFGMGEDDTFIIFELPDNAAAAGLTKRVTASDTGHCNIMPIFTPEEMDQAILRDAKFFPPGS
jgi:uncharacterized protein with GYD domain